MSRESREPRHCQCGEQPGCHAQCAGIATATIFDNGCDERLDVCEPCAADAEESQGWRRAPEGLLPEPRRRRDPTLAAARRLEQCQKDVANSVRRLLAMHDEPCQPCADAAAFCDRHRETYTDLLRDMRGAIYRLDREHERQTGAPPAWFKG